MSLKDTIRGAREEASASGNPFERSSSTDQEAQGQGASSTKRAGARRSVARAKPSREAAAGVRVVSSNGKQKNSKENMTKEERKAERKAERELEDRRYSLTQAYMNEDEEYKQARKRWWIFLGVGMGLVVVAFTLYGIVNQQGTSVHPAIPFLAMGTMACSYIAIIGGLIYDWVKIRPMRKKVEKRVASMSDKRVKTTLNQKAREQAEEEERSKRKRKK